MDYLPPMNQLLCVGAHAMLAQGSITKDHVLTTACERKSG